MKSIALQIYCVTEFGGAERRLIRIYNQIGKTLKCDLIFRGCTEDEAKLRIKNADCDTRHIHKILCFSSNTKCWKHFLKYGREYDAIHFIDVCGFNIVTAIIGKLKRYKTLYTIALVSDAYNISAGRICMKMKLLLKLASAVDLLYPWAYEKLLKIRKGDNVSVTPGTYTDLKVFAPKEKENILVYAAARLEPLKNPELLVDACLLCSDELREKNYKVILLGKGVLEEKIKEKIAACRINDILLMPGYKKTSDYFPTAKAAVSLQLRENYPSQVIAEAAASGCFLIISDVGYSRKTADETFARFVDGTSQALADAIRDYIRRSDYEQHAISENARRYAVDHYNIELSIEYFQNIIAGMTS